MIRKITDKKEKRIISSNILNDLPDWFGLPDATAMYIDASEQMPFWAYYEKDMPVGFIALKATSDDTAEIYIMGILLAYQRQGIGQQLFNTLENYAQTSGYSFIQVKTVQMGHYKEYDITNSFYLAMGFKELECFPDMWDPDNPCQIYVKFIGAS